MAQRVKITVARFSSGVTIRVEGPGTVGESPVVHAFAEKVLSEPGQRVILDLGSCTYMDSTFLGGLIGLFKRDRQGQGDRFAIFAPEPQRRVLFGASRLDKVLPFVSELPSALDAGMPLDAQGPLSREELARYIIDCHRRLAEIGGPEAQDYARVADEIASELDTERHR